MSKKQITQKVLEPVYRARAMVTHIHAVLPLVREEILGFFKDESLAVAMIRGEDELAKLLKDAADNAEAAEQARALEAADDDVPREQRNKAAAKVYGALVDSRIYLISGFGEGAEARYGLAGSVPQETSKLLSMSKNCIRHLEDHPEQRTSRFGVAADTAQVINELRPLQEELVEALKWVGVETVEYRDAQTKRDQALEQLQRVFSGTSRRHIGMLTLIGRQDLIQKMYAISRKRRRSEDSDTEAAQTEAPKDQG